MTEALSYSEAAASDLPLEVTTFVGRRSERTAVRELMTRSKLVTLTGFGGVGKSRLALRVASDLRRTFEGVHVVPLGGLVSPEEVPDRVALSLGLHGRSVHSATIAAVEFLRPRRVLLVLDNCEHVIDVIATIAHTFLRTCPGVHILATSREPLRIDGESVFPVSPLSVPDAALPAGPLTQYEAVQLFLDRAVAVVPDFVLTEANQASVAEISRRLEGIPLAIELAAARLRAFSPAELERNLTDRWELLGRGMRGAPDRHSTMTACIEWSFDLCSPSERLLWGKASVFVNGFELDAVRAVCGDPDTEPLEETLSALVEKSVVIATPHDATNRYRMLASIRHRGRLELARIGRSNELRRRHKDFYVNLVARAHDGWFGPDQLDWIGRLRRERENIGKALETCATDVDSAEQGLVAGANLMEFGLMEGRFQQGRVWFDQILNGGGGSPESRALALRTAAWWAAVQGDVENSRRLVEEGFAIVRRLGGRSQTLLIQASGFVALWAGDPSAAELSLREARRRCADDGDRTEEALCYLLLALQRALVNDVEGALEHHRSCMALTEAAGESWLRSWSLWIASLALWRRGDYQAAVELARDSLRQKHLLADALGVATLLETIAWFESGTHAERAAMLLGAAQEEWDRIDTSAEMFAPLVEPHQETDRATREKLGEGPFDLARRRGRAMGRAAAIALALAEKSLAPAAGTTDLAGRLSSSPLTRRQLEIADLIHDGLSNKEIADQLVISPRTAETHVENILTKLGFTNRGQVAAWVGEKRRTEHR